MNSPVTKSATAPAVSGATPPFTHGQPARLTCNVWDHVYYLN